jgi:hypothetical protein
MKNLSSQVEIHFRFLNLNKLQAYTLVREVPDSSYREQDEKGCYVGFVLLTKLNIDDINDFYVRQMVDINDCDICVAVQSKLKTNTVDVPQVVNRMLKYIDCKLTYSFRLV